MNLKALAYESKNYIRVYSREGDVHSDYAYVDFVTMTGYDMTGPIPIRRVYNGPDIYVWESFEIDHWESAEPWENKALEKAYMKWIKNEHQKTS